MATTAKSRVFSSLLALVLAIGLMPTVAAAPNAFADEGYAATISGDTYTIQANGTYKLESGASTSITISSDVTDVTLVGNGVVYSADQSNKETWGAISSTANAVHVDATAAPGVSLTLKDLYNSVTSCTASVFDFSGEGNTLKLEGTNVLDYNVGYTSANDAQVHVGVGSSLGIVLAAGSATYMYNCTQGANIGGVTKEMNGNISFSTTGTGTSAGKLFIKGTRQGAVIGAGASASSTTDTPGSITFNSGIYNIETNSRGAAIGGSAGSGGGSTGTLVSIYDPASVNVNCDYSGAAVGGGGYVSGNDASGGTLVYYGGSLRTYVDKNAASNTTTGWNGRALTEGVNDAVITAQRVNEEEQTLYYIAVPTNGSASATHEVTVDGESAFTGTLHSYAYFYEAVNRGEAGATDDTVNVTPLSTIGNWYDSVDSSVYLFVTGEDHAIVSDGVAYTASFDSQTGTFTVATAEKDPELALSTEAANLKVGDTITANIEMTDISAAAQAKLVWSDNLQLVKVEKGSALAFPEGEDGFEWANDEGADPAIFSFVGNTATEDGVVAVATFTCVKAGEASVSLTDGVAGKTEDATEHAIAASDPLEVSVALDALKGDLNNSKAVNIVDAQICYDLATAKYEAESAEAAKAALVACWADQGGTYDLIVVLANVNGDEALDSSDSFAIQYAVHHGGSFGA